MPYKIPLLEKILTKIRIDEDTKCWVWCGQITKVGYARQKVSKRKKLPVHRFMYNFFFDDLSRKQIVHHICENRICVNPIHLQAMTQSGHGKLLNQKL